MLSLFDDCKFDAKWWGRAGRRANNTFDGVLSYLGRPGLMTLDMAGIFENSCTYQYVDSVKGPSTVTQKETCYELPVIFGEQGNGTKLSFLDCLLQQGNHAKAAYDGRLLVVGSHKESWHELKYTTARFTFSGAGINDCVAMTKSSPLRWQIDQETQLLVDGADAFNDLAVFKMTCASEQHIQWFFNHIFWLQNLFMVLQGAPAAIVSLDFETALDVTDSILFKKDRHSIGLLPAHPLIPLSAVSRAEFEQAVRFWMHAGEKFKAAIYHFSSAIQFASPKHQVNLINVSQAMEAFHRELFPGHEGCYIPAHDYEELQRQLNDVVGKCLKDLTDVYQKADPVNFPAIKEAIGSLKTSLTKGRIHYGNEKSQSRRLSELLNRLNVTMPSLLKPVLDKKIDFVRKIIDTRNYYIHFSDPEQKRLTEMSIPFAVMALESLFLAIVLTELGINETLSETSISQSRRWIAFRGALNNWRQRFLTEAQRHREISNLAYEFWTASECTHGHDLKDWFDAVREIDGF